MAAEGCRQRAKADEYSFVFINNTLFNQKVENIGLGYSVRLQLLVTTYS